MLKEVNSHRDICLKVIIFIFKNVLKIILISKYLKLRNHPDQIQSRLIIRILPITRLIPNLYQKVYEEILI